MKFISFAGILILLTACTSVSVDSTWKDADYRGGPITNIAVRVIDHDPIVEALLEDRFCEELRKHGVTASRLPPTAVLDATSENEDSPARLAQPGVQAVLVAREADRQLAQIETEKSARIDQFTGGDPTRARRLIRASQDLEGWQCELRAIDSMKAFWTSRVDLRVEEIADRAEKLMPLAKTTVSRLQLETIISGSPH